MKPKKKTFIKRVMTLFASSPKLTKEVKSSGKPTLFQSVRELRRSVEELIIAQDELKKHLSSRLNDKRDPGTAVYEIREHSQEMEMMQVWGRLKRNKRLPVDPERNIRWTNWRDFVSSVRQDQSIWRRIRLRAPSGTRQKKILA